MAEYRAIRPEEWPDALVMWNEVFGVGPWLFHSLHKGTDGRKWSHCVVAVEDGEIVSAVDVFLRERRDLEGNAVRVGCIGSVATYPEHRQRGHSGRLLEMALETMREEGCDWSFLFTGTHGHYARYGWKTMPMRTRKGFWRESPAVPGARRSSPDEWPDLMSIYDQTVGRLPLAAVRTPLSWRYAQRARIARPGKALFRAGSAYAVADIGDEPGILELAGEDPRDLDALLSEVRGQIGEGAIGLGFALTPENEAAQARWFGGVVEEASPWGMARPIEGGRVDLDALFADPRSHHHSLDGF